MQKGLTEFTRFDAKYRVWMRLVFSALLAIAFTIALAFRGPIKSLALTESWAQKRQLLLVVGVLYSALLAYFSLLKRWRWSSFFYAVVLVTVALYIRLWLLNQVSADYSFFLRTWVQIFRDEGFGAIVQQIGDYNLPYLYILSIIAQIDLPDLYLIKLVSIVFDFALAIIVMHAVRRFINKKYTLVALTTLLLIPTVWFNSSFWAQCDSLYVFFAVACLYAMLCDRPWLSMVLLTVAFSFKIQTVFFFPMVLFGLYFRKIKIRHLFAFPITYLVLIAPAVLMGRPLMSALTVYLGQMAQYNDRLTYNAPNIYQLLPKGMMGARSEWYSLLQYIQGIKADQWGQWYTLESVKQLLAALVPYAGMVVFALVFYLIKNHKYLKLDQAWQLSLAFTLLIPLVLPKMHDRYFMLAEIFAVLYAFKREKRQLVPILIVSASFFSYFPFLMREQVVDLRIAALLMVGAMGIVLRDIIADIHAARRADPSFAETTNADPLEV